MIGLREGNLGRVIENVTAKIEGKHDLRSLVEAEPSKVY